MLAVDVSDMTHEEREEIGTKAMDVEVGPRGIATVPKKKRKQPITLIAPSQKNKKLLDDYGESIFNKYGAMNYNIYPPSKTLAILARKDKDSQKWFLDELGEKLCATLLYNVLPGSRLKGKTKNELGKVLEGGIGPAYRRKQPRANKTTKSKPKEKKSNNKPVDVI